MRIYFYALCSSCRLWQAEATAGPGHDAQKGSELSSGTSWQLAVEIGSRFPVRWVGWTRVWRSRSGSCLPVRHFVSFLCFADKCSRAYAANPPLAHICIELYLLLVAVVPPCSPLPPCSQRILVAKLSHLRQQCRRGCRCNWSRSWSWSRSRFRRHLCTALACIFLPFEFVKSTSINLSSVRCFGSGSGAGSVALARHLHLRRLVLHARFHFGAAQIFR